MKDGIPVGYTKFCDDYAKYVDQNNLTNHITHKPGVICEVDWSGRTMRLNDPEEGKAHLVYLFVATLPYSQLAYVEPCLNMNEQTWINCNVHMFEYFGGVTLRIVCDNLKTGVVTHPREGDIVLNQCYEDFSNHYCTAIMPAGVKKPKQKASVEGTVGKIATAIIARLRKNEYTIRQWAASIGKQTLTVVDRIFKSYSTSEQGVNPSMSVLKLSKKYSSERLETACELALEYVSVPRYSHLKAILAASQDVEYKKSENESSPAGFVRGAAYYGGDDHAE